VTGARPVAALAGALALGLACDQAGSSLPSAAQPSASATPAQIIRGEYLVRSVAGCGECHTPRDAQGNLEQGLWLSGVANRFDLTLEDDATGGISAPNLTPAALASWTDAQIQQAFLDGVNQYGDPLFPLMPYYAYHNMTAADAAAIVAYLRAIPAIMNTTPPRQALPVTLTLPAPPIPVSAIPQTTLAATDPLYGQAQQGRYLAGQVGFCLDCHTPWRLGAPQPLDMTHVFVGDRSFSAHDWGVPRPAPPIVYSYNITPDPSGIAGWTAADVALMLLEGIPYGGGGTCRPMPSGPTGSLGGLSPSDAHAIGVYLTTIPPVVGDNVPQCPATVDGGPDE
jgi:mono/diheme cytochrome c family protein